MNSYKLSPIIIDPFLKYYESAIGLLPEIKSAISRQKSAKSGIDYAKGYYYPRLSFTASMGSSYLSNASLYATIAPYTFGSQLSNNFNFYTGLSLKIPIFDGFQTRNTVRTALFNEEKAANNLELISRQIYKDVQKAYNNAISSKEKVTSSKVLLDATELSFSYMTDKLAVGAVSVYDYSQIKTKLAKANSDYLQAKYEYIFNVMILEFYNGKPISLQNNN
jgi:outer membrane protein